MTKKQPPLGTKELHRLIEAEIGFSNAEKTLMKKAFKAEGVEDKITERQFKTFIQLQRRNKLDEDAFVSRGYRYGTPGESWQAVRRLALSLDKSEIPAPDLMDWFAAAVDRCPEDDPMQLVRELGLMVRDKRPTVNAEVVAKRVNELIKGGSSIMGACEQAADELGCAAKTAHHWHRMWNKQKDLSTALRSKKNKVKAE